MSRILRNFLVTAVLTVFIAARVSAAPIPLLEMKWQQGDFENGSAPPSVEFVFFAAGYAGWTSELGPADVGKSFWAPMDVVEGVNTALNDADAGYGLGNGPGNFVGNFSLPLEQEPTSNPPCPLPGQCFGIAIYVDDIQSQRVTAVERVINYLELTDFFGNWTISASQSIRYWGEPVPEPNSAAIVLLVLLIRLGAR